MLEFQTISSLEEVHLCQLLKKITSNETSIDRTVEKYTLVRLSFFLIKNKKGNLESKQNKLLDNLHQSMVGWACARRHKIPNSDTIICILILLSDGLSKCPF